MLRKEAMKEKRKEGGNFKSGRNELRKEEQRKERGTTKKEGKRERIIIRKELKRRMERKKKIMKDPELKKGRNQHK